MSIVTKTGDNGETGLFGGQRISKADVRIHAYGTVDELNAILGMVRTENDLSTALSEQLLRIQNVLFRMGADLATPQEGNATPPRIEPEHSAELEGWISALEGSMVMPQYFVLPGGSKAASSLHLARTVCRRAERWTVELGQKEEIGPHVVIYLNRLSDYLFLACLQANLDAGIENIRVTYQ
jgi:cob(I)alamin adenosyltransferase